MHIHYGGPDALSKQECSVKAQMTALTMEETCLKNVILTASLPIFSSDTKLWPQQIAMH
jgi:hypothetical protein